MASTSYPYAALFNQLLKGKLPPRDAEALIAWLGSEEQDPEAAELILRQLEQSVANEQISPETLAALDARLPAILGQGQRVPAGRIRSLKTTWWRYTAAAAILILLGAGTYLWLESKPSKQVMGVRPAALNNDVAPGKAGAILTLADGTTVVLDSLGNGLVATQNGAKVLLHNGQLAYNTSGAAPAEMTYNTMATPKGRQFQLVLPDGTKVWLNAASSLRYPTTFAGSERTVEITGEAYFEVAKLVNRSTGQRIPFRVKVNNETAIEVLGTHFNINSYDDEKTVNTTLLEGSVRIVSGAEKAVLKPGQQAQAAASQIKIVPDANVEKVMAWKNGVFDFQDASLEEVMRELQRWYNIEVVYEKGIPQLEFIGKMGRDLTLANVLSGLEMSKVHFRIEGRKLVVLP